MVYILKLEMWKANGKNKGRTTNYVPCNLIPFWNHGVHLTAQFNASRHNTIQCQSKLIKIYWCAHVSISTINQIILNIFVFECILAETSLSIMLVKGFLLISSQWYIHCIYRRSLVITHTLAMLIENRKLDKSYITYFFRYPFFISCQNW